MPFRSPWNIRHCFRHMKLRHAQRTGKASIIWTSFRDGPKTAIMNYLIRDHDEALFRHRQQIMQEAVDFINKKYGAGTAEITITETYRNMYEQVKGHEKLISNVMTAMEHCGITPIVTPIRGGTDGARLSYQGLPCPNICTGGQNGPWTP